MTDFKKEIYKNEKGEKLYRKSFCVYFDILGFSEKIKNDDQDFFETYLTTPSILSLRLSGDYGLENENRVFDSTLQ
jgi:hypothetical protein